MSNVTISRELLQALLDFADNAHSKVDWLLRCDGMAYEWECLAEQVQAALAAPDPAPADTVTYTVMWQGSGGLVETEQEGLDETTAADRVHFGNIRWAPTINHWAVGTDGSVIGHVGAPE